MPLPANHKELVAAAAKRAEENKIRLEKQSQTDDDFVFAKIGADVPSEAEKEQLRRLAAIQQKANQAVLDMDSRIRF